MMLFFPYIGNVIIRIDELIFFRWVAQPPTSDSLLLDADWSELLDGPIPQAFEGMAWSRAQIQVSVEQCGT